MKLLNCKEVQFYKLNLDFFIPLPPEFLPVSGQTERWCAYTLGTALLISSRAGTGLGLVSRLVWGLCELGSYTLGGPPFHGPPSCQAPRQPTIYAPRGDWTGPSMRVYLNLKHALTHSATTAGWIFLLPITKPAIEKVQLEQLHNWPFRMGWFCI